MYDFLIGEILDSFRFDTKEAVKEGEAIGIKGLQMYCTRGAHGPENFGKEQRRDLLQYVKDHGMVFSAICGDLGRGFGDPALNPELIEQSKRIMDMAKDFETNIVTTHIGVVPADKNHDRYKIMQEACYELARYADSIGSHFAVETGPEPSAVLAEFLDSLDSTGVAVNLDPANLVMVTGDDPVQAVYNLRRYIVHTHAKDGVKLADGNPEYIYRVVHPIPEEVQGVKYFKEVPLGTGSVDFAKYLAALDDIGYRGFLTIEREVGDDPARDIQTAYEHLKKVIREN